MKTMTMKPILLCVLTMTLTVTGLLAQTCERTFTVSGSFVPSVIQAGDIEATLGKQTLTITRVEPIRSSRILIFIVADFSRLRKDKSLERLSNRLAAIDATPANVAMAYGIRWNGKVAFSGPFTSDPQELRSGWQKLVSGSVKRSSGPAGMRVAVEFFGPPQPGDTVVALVPVWSNVYAWREFFLEKSIRLFFLSFNFKPGDFPLQDFTAPAYFTDGPMKIAAALGGHYSSLDRSSEQREQQSWQNELNFWMHGIPRGYMVTVAIPDGARFEPSGWNVSVRKSVLGIEYPDLLRCDNKAKKNDRPGNRIATAARPF